MATHIGTIQVAGVTARVFASADGVDVNWYAEPLYVERLSCEPDMAEGLARLLEAAAIVARTLRAESERPTRPDLDPPTKKE